MIKNGKLFSNLNWKFSVQGEVENIFIYYTYFRIKFHHPTAFYQERKSLN